MAERSMRSRLTYSGAGSRTYAESLHWAIRWEGLRGKWFSRLAAGLKQNSVWPALTT